MGIIHIEWTLVIDYSSDPEEDFSAMHRKRTIGILNHSDQAQLHLYGGWQRGSIGRASDSRPKDLRFKPRQEDNKTIMSFLE